MRWFSGVAVALLGMTLPFLPATAAAQAQVPEGRVARIVHVDAQHPQASDSSPGTQEAPFKTIGKGAATAVANNKAGIGTKVLIHSAVYREAVILNVNGQETDAPIVFEAVGQAVMSGSDIWTGWQAALWTTGLFLHQWPYAWGLAPYPSGWRPYVTLLDVVRRREMIFTNGAALDQVLTPGELQTGRFYVDERTKTVAVQVPPGTDINRVTVEVAVRPQLFVARGKTNIVLRGLTFRHGNVALDGRAVEFVDSRSILIEDCTFEWNNWHGLGISALTDTTVRRTVASNNGGGGITTWRAKNLLIEEVTTSTNNWRGFKGGFTGWAMAGIKSLRTRGGSFRRHTAVNNRTHGLWFDTDSADVLVEGAVLCDNLRHGLYLEANQGPITVRDSRICRNQDVGVLIANAERVALSRNILHGNASTQIEVTGLHDAPRIETNWETGQQMSLVSQTASWSNNVVVGTDVSQLALKTTLSFALWQNFVNTLTSDRNLWFNGLKSNVFQVAGGVQLTFGAWRSTTGRDGASLFADPRFADPLHDDFRLLPDSRLLGLGWLRSPSTPSGLIVR